MKRFCILALALAGAVSTSGCAVGGFGAIGPVASVTPAPAAPAPVVYGAFLDGPAGQKLGQADRDKALASEQDALASGQRRTWKGDHGTFGYVEPAAPSTAPDAADGAMCRAFTSTIFIGGRPQVGHGRGCQGPDGSYRLVG